MFKKGCIKQSVFSTNLSAGLVFGNLTALRFIEYRKMAGDRRRAYWLWRCTCGNDKVIQARFVLNGSIKSCGCLTGKHTKGNVIRFDNGVGYCLLNGKYGDGKYFMFSLEDLNLVYLASWFLTKKGYVYGHLRGTQRECFFHKLIILDIPENFQIDHINGNKQDNRRENIRVAEGFQNQANRIACGVSKQRNGTFQTEVRFKGRVYYLGTFPSFETARQAYVEKKNELCGEYSPYICRKAEGGLE
jgi:hypothetical protein